MRKPEIAETPSRASAGDRLPALMMAGEKGCTMNTITLYDAVWLCTEARMLTVNIWSNSQQEIVWTGTAIDLPHEYHNKEIQSFDVPSEYGTMTFNIE